MRGWLHKKRCNSTTPSQNLMPRLLTTTSTTNETGGLLKQNFAERSSSTPVTLLRMIGTVSTSLPEGDGATLLLR